MAPGEDQLRGLGRQPEPDVYPDLLRYAEHHHLDPHNSTTIKDHLSRGFWNAIRALPTHQHDGAQISGARATSR